MKALLLSLVVLSNGVQEPGSMHNGFEPKSLEIAECMLMMERNQFVLRFGGHIYMVGQWCEPITGPKI